MPPRSLRWIRPSAGASWARADGATAAVAVAAAVGLMNARRFISYGAVITLPWSWTIPALLSLTKLAGRAHRVNLRRLSPEDLVIRASVRGMNRSRKVRHGGPVVPPGYKEAVLDVLHRGL